MKAILSAALLLVGISASADVDQPGVKTFSVTHGSHFSLSPAFEGQFFVVNGGTEIMAGACRGYGWLGKKTAMAVLMPSGKEAFLKMESLEACQRNLQKMSEATAQTPVEVKIDTVAGRILSIQ